MAGGGRDLIRGGGLVFNPSSLTHGPPGPTEDTAEWYSRLEAEGADAHLILSPSAC